MRTDPEPGGCPAPPRRPSDAAGVTAARPDQAPRHDEHDPDFALRVRKEGGRIVVELPAFPSFPDERKACEFREKLNRLVDSRPEQLHVDLRHVRHGSSFLVTTLVLLHRKVREVGGRLVLRNLDSNLQHVLRSCKLDGMFETSSEEA